MTDWHNKSKIDAHTLYITCISTLPGCPGRSLVGTKVVPTHLVCENAKKGGSSSHNSRNCKNGNCRWANRLRASKQKGAFMQDQSQCHSTAKGVKWCGGWRGEEKSRKKRRGKEGRKTVSNFVEEESRRES